MMPALSRGKGVSEAVQQELSPVKVAGHLACLRKPRALAASRLALAGEANVIQCGGERA